MVIKTPYVWGIPRCQGAIKLIIQAASIVHNIHAEVE